MAQLTVATWNTEWRKPGSRDGEILRERLAAHSPDIVVLTETHLDFLSGWGGHYACGPREYEEPRFETCRSVMLWSRWPWQDIDLAGSPGIPFGCIVKATAESPLGLVPVVGLVIPYHMSNVTNGTRNLRLWEDHERCLDGLAEYLPTLPANTLVLGDFNQRIPFAWGARRLNAKLLEVFGDFQILTTGEVSPIGEQAIDHVACGNAWRGSSVESISNTRDDGKRISDHFGLVAKLDLEGG